MIDRRAFVLLLFATHLLVSTSALAQAAKGVHRIAMVEIVAPVKGMVEGGSPIWDALLKGLRRLGYVEGANLFIERYSTSGREDANASIAAQVIATKPDLIFARGVPLVKSLLAATRTIPIVTVTADPVLSKIAASLARPDGNVTGLVADAGAGLDLKRMELLREVVPSASRVGYLLRRDMWDGPFAAYARSSARRLGMTLVPALSNVPGHEDDYERVFARMANDKVDAIVGRAASEHLVFKSTINRLAVQARLPSIHCQPQLARAGALMSYGPNMPELYRRAGSYIDKILKGARPAELPFEQASRFRLVVNLKTAKALGITFPPSILLRADEVIE